MVRRASETAEHGEQEAPDASGKKSSTEIEVRKLEVHTGVHRTSVEREN